MITSGDNGNGISSYYIGKGNAFHQENHMNKQYKVIDDIVPDKRPQQSDGTQHTTEEKLFRNMNFYDMVRLKLLGCLLVDAAI